MASWNGTLLSEGSWREVFSKFIKFVTEQRRAAATDKKMKLFANTYKGIQNSSYGYMLLNQQRFENTKYVQGDGNARNVINDNKFRRMTCIGLETYEVNLAPRRIKINSCNAVGLFVLSRAKIVLLRFIYTFLYSYVNPRNVSLIYTDTDSIYVSLCYDSLAEAVRSDKKAEFNNYVFNKCGQHQPLHDIRFFLPRECCKACAIHDVHTPFIFKVEYSGDLMISIASKTYLARCNDKYKISAKGVSIRELQRNKPEAIFRGVITKKQPYYAINRGFKILADGVVTYSQKKLAFSYLYLKRGIFPSPHHNYTFALGLVLNPAKVDYTCIQSERASLSLDHVFSFHVNSTHFTTVRQAFVHMTATRAKMRNDARAALKTVSLEELMTIFKKCDSRVNNDVKQSFLSLCIRKKWEMCTESKDQLSMSYTNELVNIEQNTFLGAGEEVCVAKWLNYRQFGGQNRVGITWMKIKHGENYQ